MFGLASSDMPLSVQFDDNHTQHANVSFDERLASAASVGGGTSHTVIKAAGLLKPLLLGAGLAAGDALYGECGLMALLCTVTLT